jgi:hypothetical protein
MTGFSAAEFAGLQVVFFWTLSFHLEQPAAGLSSWLQPAVLLAQKQGDQATESDCTLKLLQSLW